MFVVAVVVTSPDDVVVVVDTELNTVSMLFCMPPKMPSWPDAGAAARVRDAATASASAARAGRNYFSPITATA